MLQALAGVRDLPPLFDNLIVDQYGVLHDGQAPYPGAVDALVRLKQSGCRVLLLSNSGKRSEPNEQRLLTLGFQAGSWDHFLSSGEIAWRMLDAQLKQKGRKRCLLVARGGDLSAIDSLPLDLVQDGREADVVLISGSDGDRIDLDEYRRMLSPAAERAVPCICTNPDKIMLTPVGLRFGAGRIAELYASLGGEVTWIGKPFPDIYAAAITLLGNPSPTRTACIGDSIEHDIAGAEAAGLPSVLVATGILADLSAGERSAVFAEHGVTPDYTMPAFAW